MTAVAPSYCYNALLREHLAKGDKLLALDMTNRRFVILPCSGTLPAGCTIEICLISEAVQSLRELFSGSDYLDAIKPQEALALLGNLRWLQKRQQAHNQSVQALCCRISSLACIPLCCIPCCSPRIKCQFLDGRALYHLARKTKISITWPKLFDLNRLMMLFLQEPFLTRQFPEIASTVLGEALVSDHQTTFPVNWKESWLMIANQLAQIDMPKTPKRDDRLVVFPAFFLEHKQAWFFWGCLQLIQNKPVLIEKTSFIVAKLTHNAIYALENGKKGLRSRGISMVDPLKCHRSILYNSLNNWSEAAWLETALCLFGFQRKRADYFSQTCKIIKLYKQYKPVLQVDLVESVSYSNFEAALELSSRKFSLVIYSYYTDPTEQICLLVLKEMKKLIPETSFGYDQFLSLYISSIEAGKKLAKPASSSFPDYQLPLAITVVAPTHLK